MPASSRPGLGSRSWVNRSYWFSITGCSAKGFESRAELAWWSASLRALRVRRTSVMSCAPPRLLIANWCARVTRQRMGFVQEAAPGGEYDFTDYSKSIQPDPFDSFVAARATYGYYALWLPPCVMDGCFEHSTLSLIGSAHFVCYISWLHLSKYHSGLSLIV